MKEQFKPRKLTVSYESQQRPYNCYVQVPRIHLAGIWLHEAGFAIGNKVELTVTPNRIVIKRLPAPATTASRMVLHPPADLEE